MLQIDVSADTSLAPYHEPPYLNSSPKVPGPSSPAAALDEGSWLAVWERIETLWPWKASDAPHRVREKIREMDPSERRGVIPAAEAYLADCRAKGKQAASARGFFGGEAWRDWALKARGGKGKDVGSPVFVIAATPAWDAWARFDGLDPNRRFSTTSASYPGKRGLWKPTLFPPRGGGQGAPGG
jgi:hypothetical protein